VANLINNIPGHNLGQIDLPGAAGPQYPQQSHQKNPFGQRNHSHFYYNENLRKIMWIYHSPFAKGGKGDFWEAFSKG
jgi:hypothetical protein